MTTRRRERAAAWAGFGVSVLLHGAALLLAWWLLPGPRPAPPRPMDRLTVALRPLPPPPAPAAPAVPAPPSPPARQPPPLQPAPPPATTTASPGPVTPGAAPSAPPGPTTPERGSSEWLASEGLAPAQGPGGPSGPRLGDLAGSGGLGRRLAGGGGPGGAAGGGAGGEGAQARVQGTLDQAAAVARAQVPDGYWTPLRERMTASFKPDWSALDAGPKEAGGASTRLGRTVGSYLEEAQRYGRIRAPTDRPGLDGDTSGEAGDVIGRMAAAASGGSGPLPTSMEQGENPFHRDTETLVRVVQSADGAVERVELVSPSGHRALDRLALQAARQALLDANLGPTPAQGRETLWAFQTRFEVIPPAPALACPPDAIWKGDLERCAWPLKRLVASRVELREIR
ncbi:MAG: energy transducer TonB [Anaeromyxobacter sp.]